MMHKSTTVATATVTMGTCTFLIALTPVRFTTRMKASKIIAMPLNSRRQRRSVW